MQEEASFHEYQSRRITGALRGSHPYVLKSIQVTYSEGLHEAAYKYRNNGGPIPLLEHVTFRGPNGNGYKVQADVEMSGEVDEMLFTLSHFGLSEPSGNE
ncbi:hypothetical protein CA85_31320 [Allorhodopirellula solitaria]|uniref:Uncharacterized protein n=1 Tax=Allorhodopirellula solitaria TaxID=2527987 RepID=A0A5C5XQP8_9BACT|nr:hypothetical protein CA85_31320 [Allorhodopirellula solitaria]